MGVSSEKVGISSVTPFSAVEPRIGEKPMELGEKGKGGKESSRIGDGKMLNDARSGDITIIKGEGDEDIRLGDKISAIFSFPEVGTSIVSFLSITGKPSNPGNNRGFSWNVDFISFPGIPDLDSFLFFRDSLR